MDGVVESLVRVFRIASDASRRLLIFNVISIFASTAILAIAVLVLRQMDPTRLHDLVDRALQEAPRLLSALLGAGLGALIILTFRNVIVGLQRESKDYARKISRREGTSISASIAGITVTGQTNNARLRRTIRELREQVAALKDAPTPVDISIPEKLFQVARQRLLDEAVRIDSISRRNLIIGTLFSIIALGVLAWPLIAAAFQQVNNSENFNVFVWAAQYYLPRFAVGLLLQFVGFFSCGCMWQMNLTSSTTRMKSPTLK